MKRYISLLRHLVFRLSTREKALVTVFFFACLLLWMVVAFRGYGGLVRDWRIAKTNLDQQRFVLSQRHDIDARMDAALARLKSDQTFTASELVGKVDEIARRQEGVNYEIFTPRTESDAEFNLHSVRIRFRRANIAELLAFNQDLQSEEPYITLEHLRIVANTGNPTQLDAQFMVSSFELKAESLR